MRARQWAYFGAWSDKVSAVEVEERVGLRPDRVLVRGSKDPDRPLPVQHLWAIESQRQDCSLDDQIREVLARVAPVEAALAELQSDGRDLAYVFHIVRYLNDLDAPAQETLPLGFGFDGDALRLFARLDVRIDVDEYDGTLGEE